MHLAYFTSFLFYRVKVGREDKMNMYSVIAASNKHQLRSESPAIFFFSERFSADYGIA
jgi:hypothetical protein